MLLLSRVELERGDTHDHNQMDKIYNIDGLTFMGNALRSQRDFISWKNVWLFAQTLIVIQALILSAGMPAQALVIAFVAVWIIHNINKI